LAAASRLRAAPCETRELAVIDMDGDRHACLGVDADQADDGAEIDDAVDAYA
jgi:hypothetical protein